MEIKPQILILSDCWVSLSILSVNINGSSSSLQRKGYQNITSISNSLSQESICRFFFLLLIFKKRIKKYLERLHKSLPLGVRGDVALDSRHQRCCTVYHLSPIVGSMYLAFSTSKLMKHIWGNHRSSQFPRTTFQLLVIWIRILSTAKLRPAASDSVVVRCSSLVFSLCLE